MKRVAMALVCAQMLVVAVAATTVVSTTANAFGCLPADVVVDPTSTAGPGLDVEQHANAAVIAKAVIARRLPIRAAVIAVATAMQESSLRNLSYGDRDSLGLFQQRPSQGWGNPTRAMDPVAATNAFLDRLVDVPGWPRLPLTVAAQAVQRSAYPDAYARWEPQATELAAGLLGRPSPPSSAPPSAADLPGLFVLADGPLAAHAERWPTNYQGGEVVVATRACLLIRVARW